MADDYNIGVRNAAYFIATRPPLPWSIADRIAQALDDVDCKAVGIAGSLEPSVLISCGFERPERQLNAWAQRSGWDSAISWNFMIEDCQGIDAHTPWAKTRLPLTERQMRFPEGASPLYRGNSIFIDLPYGGDPLNLNIESFGRHKMDLLLLGFLEGHRGPDDVLAWSKTQP